MKVVVNRCYGGFGLSDKATEMVMNRKGLDCFRYYWDYESNGLIRCKPNQYYYIVYYLTKDMGERFDRNEFDRNELSNDVYWHNSKLERTDLDLIAVVEELGKEANGEFARLEVVEIPGDVDWEIDEYDGWEKIYDVHRVW